MGNLTSSLQQGPEGERGPDSKYQMNCDGIVCKSSELSHSDGQCCNQKPCPVEKNEVCDVDGNKYDNECTAKRAGVKKVMSCKVDE